MRITILTIVLIVFANIDSACAERLVQEPAKAPPTQEWREMIGTGFSGSSCIPADPAIDPGGRICKGPKGYSLLLKGDEVKPEVYLIAPNQRRFQIRYWDTSDPKYQGLDNGALWIVVNATKEISVTFTMRITQRDDYTYSDSYDTIVRVSPGPVCVVGSVPAGSTSAGESVAIASSPRSRRCLGLHEREKKNWFLAGRRLASEGQIGAAKFALTKIRAPSERFIVYREIAVAQFKAGDAKGARGTLMAGRAEALRKPLREELRFTLSHVVSGMAETGFYESAKAEIKQFPEEERLSVYLDIAGIQGERGDLQASKKTIQEAIEVEIKRNPPSDPNLSRIAFAQAHRGLIDDARKTASMMRDPEFRKLVEERIEERRPRPE